MVENKYTVERNSKLCVHHNKHGNTRYQKQNTPVGVFGDMTIPLHPNRISQTQLHEVGNYPT